VAAKPLATETIAAVAEIREKEAFILMRWDERDCWSFSVVEETCDVWTKQCLLEIITTKGPRGRRWGKTNLMW
jgi:hypothetical protein